MNIRIGKAKDPVNIFPAKHGKYKAEFNGKLGIGATPRQARENVIQQLTCQEMASVLAEKYGIKYHEIPDLRQQAEWRG